MLAGIVEGLPSGVGHAIYDGVEPNPSTRCVDESVAMYRSEGCDCLLGVGGGSSIDTAKVAGAVLSYPEIGIAAMEGVGRSPAPSRRSSPYQPPAAPARR